jgi:hypothetical protein
MKNLFKVLLVICCLFFISVVLAEKPTESPRFQSGVMGEIFEGLTGAGGQSIITSSDLVGEWTFDAFASYSTHSLIDDNWVPGSEDLFLKYLEGTLFFNDDEDGSFSITFPGQDPFHLITTDTVETPSYVVVGDTIYRKCYVIIGGQTYSSIASFSIKRITQNIIIFKFLSGSDFNSKVVICQRVLTP